MNQTVLEPKTRDIKEKMTEIIPHTYSFLLKEDILKARTEINEGRVELIKRAVQRQGLSADSSKLSERIIRGVE